MLNLKALSVAVVIGIFSPIVPINILSESHVLAQTHKERKAEADRLLNQGIQQLNTSQFREALQSWQEALKIYQEIGDRKGEADCLNNLGLVYSNLGEYQKAIEYHQQSLTIKQEIGDRNGEAASLNNLGNTYLYLGEYQKAIGYNQQSLPIFEQIGNRNGEASSLMNLGNAYFSLRLYQKAIEYHQQSLPIFQQIGNRNGEAGSLTSLGLVYRDLGEYQKAIEYYQQSLTIFEQIGNRSGEAVSLDNLGNAYASLGEYQKAIEYHQQSLPIFEQIGNRSGEAVSLDNLGNAYASLGEYQKAIEYYRQSLTITREIGDRNGEANSLNNLGNAYASLEEYNKAIEYHQQSLPIFEKIGNRNGEAASLNNLGIAYRNLGQYQKAIEYYRQSLTITREIGDRNGEAKSLNNLGLSYISLGEYQKAIEYYQQSLPIFEQIGARNEKATILSNIGILLQRQNQPKLAITFLKQSINVTEAIRQDIQGLSSDLQQSFIDSVDNRYRRLADLLLKENRVLEAQRVLDLLKVQELEDYLKNVRGNANTASGIEFYQPEQDILNRYNELNQNAIEAGEELAELQQKDNLTPAEEQRRNQLDQLLTEIKADFNNFSRSPEIRALIEKLSFDEREQTLSLGELDRLRDKLGELNAALFYPLILDDRLELVITTPNSPPLRRTVEVSREEFNRAIIQFRLALQNPSRNAVIPAQKLYKWLLEPLENDLKAANTEVIIYAPDGVLRYIPLVALHDGEQWLAERFRVNNITAASLEEIDTQPQPQPKVLAGAFADQSLIRSARIGEDDVDFSGLPFAGIEVEGLRNTLPNTTAYVDEAFNLAAMKPKMNGYNVLHLATHAAFVPGDPTESFIVFGNGENPTLRDVENWSLSNVDLVVLSACETGLGGFDNNGEQILGLGYQFQNQGARAVLASLWQVNDGGTQLLMNEFYHALQQGNSKTEALQTAQQALIVGNLSSVGGERGPDGTIVLVDTETGLAVNVSDNLNHPYYWASFILIGNGL
ncbi:MAG: tetratricopeptide repeat protein [Microcoleaceae cyanobacterium]